LGKAIIKKTIKLNNKTEKLAAIKSLVKIISFIYLDNNDLRNTIIMILMKILPNFDIYEESNRIAIYFLIIKIHVLDLIFDSSKQFNIRIFKLIANKLSMEELILMIEETNDIIFKTSI
jgi:hypothetical protein